MTIPGEYTPRKYKVGDRVRINHNCHEAYWDVIGMITGVDNFCEFDNFDYEITFDKPMGKLKYEYFAENEIDKV
jgi:hypothetical protein